MKLSMKTTATTLLLLQSLILSTFISADTTSEELNGEVQDAWLLGKIETVFLLNSEVNSFLIDTDVESGVVTLSGEVSNEIEKDLVAELAKGVDRVKRVHNNVTVNPDLGIASLINASEGRPGNDLVRWVDDATTTAIVKTKLLANKNTKGLDIEVDTTHDVVTLKGEVSSEDEKALAEQITANVADVDRVENLLLVTSR